MLITDFSGGKNIRVAPHLLQPNESQIHLNIDSSSGVLRPIKGPISTGVVIDKYFTYYYSNNEWISRTLDSDFVEFRDTMYISNGNTMEEYTDEGSSTLGIPGPTDIIPLEGTFIGTPPVFTPSSPGTMTLAGTFSYIISFYSSVLDTIIYKDYSYAINTYSKDGYDININISGLSSLYFAAGDAIVVYREDNGIYYKVDESTYLVSGITIVDDTLNISTNDVLSTSYSAEVYTYVYTYYDSTTGVESTPSLPSEDQRNGIGGTIIGAIPKSPHVKVDTIRVYRIGGLLTQYTLLDELDNPPVATNPYIDIKLDIDIVGNHLLDSVFNDLPINGLKYVVESYAMLFAASDSKLYYSDIAKPYAWPATNFTEFEEDITGIGAISTGILVFTRFKTYIIVGNNPQSFTKYLLSSSQGCISHKSIQFVDNNLIWMSEDGICSTSGGTIQVVSLPKLGKFSVYQLHSTALLDSVYYISYKTGLVDSITAFDFRYNTIVKDLDVTGEILVSKKDALYQYYNGTLQQLLVGEDLEMHYKSPMLTEGSYSNYKVYKDIYIKYDGSFEFKVYIDKVLINTISLTGDKCYNLKALGISKGYGIEFEVIGVGEISEIGYTAKGRQDASN